MSNKKALTLAVLAPIIGIALYVFVVGANTYSGAKNYAENAIFTTRVEKLDSDTIERLINSHRQSVGLKTLVHDEVICADAQVRLTDIDDKEYWSHTSSDGKQAQDFTQFNFEWLGENLAYGQFTEEQVLSEWLKSETHRENIEKDIYTHQCVVTDSVEYMGRKQNLTVSWFVTPK